MIVKFATTCDYFINDSFCALRSPEYTSWPTCRICGNDTCTEHMRPGSKTEPDVDYPETCICLNCEDE